MVNRILEIIEESIEVFFNSNWEFKDFLTEEDVRSRLFCELNNSLRNFNNISVHSEIRWYGDEKGDKLKYRSDIVILDNTDLDVEKKGYMQLPSKGYAFNKYYAIIELKLRRPNSRISDKKFEEKIKSDIKKLQEIKNRTISHSHSRLFYLITFDKKDKNKKLFNINNKDKNQIKNWL